jgi:alpha-glucosidase
MRWRDATVYQIYPRSFQDSDGDGVGDVQGIAQRLDHLVDLGVDAFWLSPIYPSPLADFGYDISDFTSVEPQLGTLEDFDELVAQAHDRGLRVLLDFVPNHTSIEHPWFREHPDWYIFSPVDGPPNNWVSAFGGPAWTKDEVTGRWYLHSFYPEQPDLNWRNPELVEAMQDVIRFWRDRGADGFRVDALDRLLKDDELRDEAPASEPFPLPVHADAAKLARARTTNQPEIGVVLNRIREAAGDAFLVGEVYLPTSEYPRYLEARDAVFAFELLFSPWDAEQLRRVIASAAAYDVAWVLSNHDFDRLATRVGPKNLRAAALLLLSLPGTAFIYQGDEIGMANGPGGRRTYDRAGRDPLRHPMQWDASPNGGFTTGEPWLPTIDPKTRNVVAQREDPASLLNLYRSLIDLRGQLGDGFRLLDSSNGLVAFDRGRHTVAINTTDRPQPMPHAGDVVLETHPGALAEGILAPHAGAISLPPG